jgi:hypothetical protein
MWADDEDPVTSAGPEEPLRYAQERGTVVHKTVDLPAVDREEHCTCTAQPGRADAELYLPLNSARTSQAADYPARAARVAAEGPS